MSNRDNELRELGVEPVGNHDGGKRFSFRNLKTFQSFTNPVYRIYFGAIVSLWFAHSMQMISRNLLVYRLTDSGAVLGFMALAQAIPSLTISLLGGAIADRIQKKYIMVVGQLATAVISLWLAITLGLGYLDVERWWLLLVAAALQGTVMGLMMPAQTAIIPEIVGEEKVMNAISLTMMGQTALQLVGPALAGILIDTFDFAAVYYLMTGFSVVGVVFSFFLPFTSRATTSGENTLADMLEGLRYIRRNTTILLIIVFGIVHMISGLPYMQLLPMFTEDILDVGASGIGILTSVSGIGAVIGSLVLASLPNKKRGILLLFSGVIMGLSLIVFSWSTSWYLSLGIIPVVGLGPTLHGALTATLIQYYVDPDYRGRMQSFVAMSSGLASFGTFLAGVMSEAIGVQWSVGGMAMFLTIVSFIFFAFARKITRLE